MAYYTEIRFNEPLFINDFNMLMEKAHIESWSTAINSADKDVWKDIKYISSYDQTSIYTESVNAFIKIYGSGVKSDKNNPFLSDYMSSETFNKQRSKNMEVHYRPKTYKTYDWKNDSFDIVEAKGSGKQGVISNFPASEPHINYMTDVLKSYLVTFIDYASMGFADIEKNFNNGKYYTTAIVKI